MLLCFDIGNTDIYGGVFEGTEVRYEFRKSNQSRPSADEFGVFMLHWMQARGIDPKAIDAVGIASVVPDSLPSVVNACRTYLDLEPLVLEVGVKTGLKIQVHDPREVGADRIANAIAAVQMFPGRDLLVVDMGTATTVCAITRDKVYLGGAIIAGLRLCMNALGRGTAKLPLVDIIRPTQALGKTTIDNIQSGLYFGHIGTLKEIFARLRQEAFAGREPLIIGTGGFSRLFREEGLFDEIIPGLVLQGLRLAVEMNPAPLRQADR
ncbi:MAG: type III pantothenate kinase [Verrucomicrobiota bacterium JB022]|nr:type III pantothenate kinase [Verrucomicrobiota bacterium JB022]